MPRPVPEFRLLALPDKCESTLTPSLSHSLTSHCPASPLQWTPISLPQDMPRPLRCRCRSFLQFSLAVTCSPLPPRALARVSPTRHLSRLSCFRHSLFSLSPPPPALSFLLPLLLRVSSSSREAAGPSVLVLAPTRELCMQIEEQAKQLVRGGLAQGSGRGMQEWACMALCCPPRSA